MVNVTMLISIGVVLMKLQGTNNVVPVLPPLPSVAPAPHQVQSPVCVREREISPSECVCVRVYVCRVCRVCRVRMYISVILVLLYRTKYQRAFCFDRRA